MKLFVWNNCYRVSYGGSCLYVVAENVDEARKQARYPGISYFGGMPTENTQNCDVTGPPDRVHDIPYAEVYQWEE